MLLSKLGLDSHDLGLKVAAEALRNAGMEVIYLGAHNTLESIVQTALQEDVDVIGISCLCGEHLTLLPLLIKLIGTSRVDIPVVTGGLIPLEDIPKVKAYGAKEVVTSGASFPDIVRCIRAAADTEDKRYHT